MHFERSHARALVRRRLYALGKTLVELDAASASASGSGTSQSAVATSSNSKNKAALATNESDGEYMLESSEQESADEGSGDDYEEPDARRTTRKKRGVKASARKAGQKRVKSVSAPAQKKSTRSTRKAASSAASPSSGASPSVPATASTNIAPAEGEEVEVTGPEATSSATYQVLQRSDYVEVYDSLPEGSNLEPRVMRHVFNVRRAQASGSDSERTRPDRDDKRTINGVECQRVWTWAHHGSFYEAPDGSRYYVLFERPDAGPQDDSESWLEGVKRLFVDWIEGRVDLGIRVPDWVKTEGFKKRLPDWLAGKHVLFSPLLDDFVRHLRGDFVPDAAWFAQRDVQSIDSQLAAIAATGGSTASVNASIAELTKRLRNIIYMDVGTDDIAWLYEYLGKSRDGLRRACEHAAATAIAEICGVEKDQLHYQLAAQAKKRSTFELLKVLETAGDDEVQAEGLALWELLLSWAFGADQLNERFLAVRAKHKSLPKLRGVLGGNADLCINGPAKRGAQEEVFGAVNNEYKSAIALRQRTMANAVKARYFSSLASAAAETAINADNVAASAAANSSSGAAQASSSADPASSSAAQASASASVAGSASTDAQASASASVAGSAETGAQASASASVAGSASTAVQVPLHELKATSSTSDQDESASAFIINSQPPSAGASTSELIAAAAAAAERAARCDQQYADACLAADALASRLYAQGTMLYRWNFLSTPNWRISGFHVPAAAIRALIALYPEGTEVGTFAVRVRTTTPSPATDLALSCPEEMIPKMRGIVMEVGRADHDHSQPGDPYPVKIQHPFLPLSRAAERLYRRAFEATSPQEQAERLAKQAAKIDEIAAREGDLPAGVSLDNVSQLARDLWTAKLRLYANTMIHLTPPEDLANLVGKDALTISLVDTDLDSVLSMSNTLKFEGRTNIPMVPVRLITRGGNGIYGYDSDKVQRATQYEEENGFGIVLLDFYGNWVAPPHLLEPKYRSGVKAQLDCLAQRLLANAGRELRGLDPRPLIEPPPGLVIANNYKLFKKTTGGRTQYYFTVPSNMAVFVPNAEVAAMLGDNIEVVEGERVVGRINWTTNYVSPSGRTKEGFRFILQRAAGDEAGATPGPWRSLKLTFESTRQKWVDYYDGLKQEYEDLKLPFPSTPPPTVG